MSGYTETDTTGMLSAPTVWPLSVAADIDSTVFDFYSLIWSLSRLLCCVGSGFNVAVALGYGYIGARTDTTQQTNFCLGIHCRNVWLHLNLHPFCPLQRHSNPMLTASKYLARLSARNKFTFFGARQSGKITFQSYRFQRSR